MNIIMGDEVAQDLADRFMVLALDQFDIPGAPAPVQAYCVIEDPGLEDLLRAPELQRLHAEMLQHYRTQQWDQCLDCVHRLRGAWRGQVDTFLDDLAQRVQQHRHETLPPGWSGVRPGHRAAAVDPA